MSKPTQQQAGRAFEREWAALLGARVVPGSGAFWWAKLDVRGSNMIWSLKLTGKKTLSITRDLIHEARDAVLGPSGVGAGTVFAFGTDIAGEKFVVMQADDFMDLVSRVDLVAKEPTKRQKRQLRQLSSIQRRRLREEEADGD